MQILADGLDKALLRLGLEHGESGKVVVSDSKPLKTNHLASATGANGMDSTELMRELNASIDVLLDSENYLLSLNEYMNEARVARGDTAPSASHPHARPYPPPGLVTRTRAPQTAARKHTRPAARILLPDRPPPPPAAAVRSCTGSAPSRPP